VGSLSLLLPVTSTLEPVQAIIMLAGIYYGAHYGGSTPSILINILGEAASVVTCLDGYQMAKKGRAGPALGIAAMGSFIGATIAVALIFFMAPPLADLALKFGPPEFVGLTILGLTLVTYLSSGSMVKALLMAVVGVLLGTIGMDIVTGRERFTLGIDALFGGISIVPVAMGLFGIAEVLSNIEKSLKKREFFAAAIDGCSRIKALVQIVIPLIRPGLAAVAVLTFLASWNEFPLALTLTGEKAATLPLITLQYVAEQGTFWGPIAATCILILGPGLAFVLVAQKHIVKGLKVGAIKG
jgi:TctA family transporter